MVEIFHKARRVGLTVAACAHILPELLEKKELFVSNSDERYIDKIQDILLVHYDCLVSYHKKRNGFILKFIA